MNRAQRRRRNIGQNARDTAVADVPSLQYVQEAFSDYHTGRHVQAAEKCREILGQTPDQVDALHLLGIITHEQGRPREAAALISRAINIDPAQPSFYNSMGVVLKSCGKLEEATTCYSAALKLAPNDAGTLNNLANALRDQGRLAEATEYFSRSLEINPGDALAHYNLALALEDLGQIEDALVSYRHALAIDPHNEDTLNNLGLLYLKQKNPVQALAYFNHVRDLKPHSADIHNNIGNAYHQAGEPDKAITAYHRALEVNPTHVDAHFNLGLILQEKGDLDEAIAYYRQALAGNPHLADAHTGLAEIYEKRHQIEKLKEHIDTAIRLDPLNPSATRLSAVLLRREGKHDEALAKLARIPLPTDHDCTTESIHFELGRLYDLGRQSDLAIHHFAEGNRLQMLSAEGTRADKNRYLGEIRRLHEYYTQSYAGPWPATPQDLPAQTPSFIIGFPRSGTTLMDQILDSHPQLQVLEEKPALESIQRAIAEMPGAYPGALAALDDDTICRLRSQYFDVVEKYLPRNPGTLLVDKFPLQISHVGLIHRIFPGARLILALRHPCDVCLSCFMQSFVPNDAMANFSTLADTAVLYDEVMRLWQRSCEIFPLTVQALKYETLVENFRAEVAALLQFLGVEWDEAVMNYAEHAKTRKSINTPSYNQVTEPVYQRAKYRWKRYEPYLAPVMPRLRPHLEYFGY